MAGTPPSSQATPAAPAAPATKPYARLEGWIWTLIYGGLFAVVLGIAVGRNNAALGWIFAVPGAVVAIVGAVLIYVRSRLDGAKPNIEKAKK